MKRAVFLDRDGVLVEDVDLLARVENMRLLPDAPAAVARLKGLGFALVVVSNQPIVARGMATESDVDALHAALKERLREIDAFYYCPHHPNATVAAFRVDCDCRKPAPGLLLRASAALGLDASRSYMVGDRASDILAGRRAGCHTIQVETGMHRAAPIETSARWAGSATPDKTCADLAEAAEYIAARET
jgi:D-glycero-D-manno-heptose 1,7-bisphosphate phosphatase